MPANIPLVSTYVSHLSQMYVMYVMMCACDRYCKQQWPNHGNEVVDVMSNPDEAVNLTIHFSMTHLC